MYERTKEADKMIKQSENKFDNTKRCFCMCDCNICKNCEVGGEFVKKFKICDSRDSTTDTKSLVIPNKVANHSL